MHRSLDCYYGFFNLGLWQSVKEPTLHQKNRYKTLSGTLFGTTAYSCFLSFCTLIAPFFLGGKDANKFSARHSPHGVPEVAVAAVRAVIAVIEEQVPRVVRIALVERSRPVVAAVACKVEAITAAIAGSGEED